MSTRSATPEDLLPSPPRPSPFGTARVSLLPASISEHRSAKKTRRGAFLAIIVAVLVVALTSVGILALRLAETAHQNALIMRGQALVADSAKYEQTREVLQGIDSVDSHLSALFTEEVDQAGLVVALRGAATGGTALTSVALTSAGPADQAPEAGTGAGLDTSKDVQLGSIDLSGTAANQRAVAAYATAVGTIPGVAVPYVTSVRSSGTGVSFTMQGTITDAILTDRFGKTASPSGTSTSIGSNE